MPITRTTSFPTNVVLSDALGTPASPSAYFGFANANGTTVNTTGPRIQSGSGNPNGVLASPLGSTWTDSATGLVYYNTDGGTTWSLASNVTRDWFGLLPQSPLNAKSDYFPGNTLDPKWTVWNPGGNVTVSVSSTTRLNIVQTPTGSPSVGGVFQTAPASTRYRVTIIGGMSANAEGFVSSGVLLGGDLIGSPATAPFVVSLQGWDGTPNCTTGLTQFNRYNSFAGVLDVSSSVGWFPMILSAFVDTIAGTVTSIISAKGNDWKSFQPIAFGTTTVNAAPTVIGICAENTNGSLVDSTYRCSMFRVDAITDPYAAMGGYA